MGKTQTRRSVSVKGTTYARLKLHCEALGVSISGFVEALVLEKLDGAGVPEPKVAPRAYPNSRPTDAELHFTF